MRARLWAACPELNDHADDAALAALDAAWTDAPVHRYNDVPAAAQAIVAALPAEVQGPWLSAWLCRHAARFPTRFAETGLAAEFAYHYTDHLHRILDQVDADPHAARLTADAFLKDAWIARGVMVPAFAQIWWPRSGISARTVLRAGPRAIAYVFGRCGGRKPFLEGHTHDPVARAYWNAAGWAEALRLAALALPAFPEARGAFGSAWFYDPAILAISPRIAFAQELQVGQGAFRLKVGSNPDAIRNACATSAERRNRYKDGRYLPTDYAIVWSRRDLIARYDARAA